MKEGGSCAKGAAQTNMKLTVKKEDMKNLNQDLGILSMDAANQIEMTLGNKVFSSEKIACQARITTANEQVISLFYAQSSQEEIVEESFCISAKLYAGLVGTLLTYDKDIVLDTDSIKEEKVYLRVGKDVEIPMEVLSSEAKKEPIIMGKDEPVFLQVTVPTAAFKKAARGGGFANERNRDGLENAHVFLNVDTGEMSFYSSDQFIIGKTGMKVKLPEVNEKTKERLSVMDKALDAYCDKTKQTRQKILLLIPSKALANLQKVVDGTEQFILAADSKHVYVAAGNKVYTLTRGAVMMGLKEICDSFGQASYPVAFSAPYEELSQAVTSLAKIISLKALKNTAVRVTVEENGIKLAISGGDDSGVISVHGKTSGTGEIHLNAEKMERVLACLDQDKRILIRFGDEKQAVRVVNGNLSDPLAENIVYAMPVKPPVSGTEEKEGDTEQADATEA